MSDQLFTNDELSLIEEALDSHLYWQVNDDHTRRSDGFIMPPLTEEEQEVETLMEKVHAIRNQQG